MRTLHRRLGAARPVAAARIDGAGEATVFLRVALPLMVPGLVTVFLLNIVAVWNNYFLPLIIFTRSSSYPLTVGLALLAQGAGTGTKGGLVPVRSPAAPCRRHPRDPAVRATAAVLPADLRRGAHHPDEQPSPPTASPRWRASPRPSAAHPDAASREGVMEAFLEWKLPAAGLRPAPRRWLDLSARPGSSRARTVSDTARRRTPVSAGAGTRPRGLPRVGRRALPLGVTGVPGSGGLARGAPWYRRTVDVPCVMGRERVDL